MDSSEEITDQEPAVLDPYKVLNLERSATTDQIKSAYRKAALRNHPDKVPRDQKAAAHTAFQEIALSYAVLSDPVRRRRYDTTGSTSEAVHPNNDNDDFSWADFYREQYCDAVSAEAIARFAETYRNSDEERADLLAAYTAHRGQVDSIYECVMLSDPVTDDERFRRIIDDAIARGEVRAYKAWTAETAERRARRKKCGMKEAAEAEELAKELGVHEDLFGQGGKPDKKKRKRGGEKDEADGEAGLAVLIQRNQQRRMNFLDQLADKYGAKAAKGGKKRRKTPADRSRELGEEEDGDNVDEPSEEAFQVSRAKLMKRKEKIVEEAARANAKPTRSSKRSKK